MARVGSFLLLLFLAPPAAARESTAVRTVTVAYEPALGGSFTGRVYVFLDRSDEREPRTGPQWFSPMPFFAQDVENWRAGEPLVFDDAASGFPGALSTVRGRYRMQAVMRWNPHARDVGRGEGNAFSDVVTIQADAPWQARLLVRHRVKERAFVQTPLVRLHETKSRHLSEFHGRSVALKAAVVLPPGYDRDATRRYPTLYVIPGFGGRHLDWQRYANDPGAGHAEDLVRVVLDPACGAGHHVFADSANNGPVGRALIEELLPALEARFRLVAAPHGRFLAGVSSGGWSCWWLQIEHPATFGGAFAFAPDPLDFRRFQTVDLYAPGANLFRAPDGSRRPVARVRGRPVAWVETLVAQESVLGRGGQFGSFEWAFSPRGADGRPRALFDRTTGAVDAEVARAWRRFDISHRLRTEWEALGRQVRGKLHAFVGAQDTFYLDGAIRLLDKDLAALGASRDIVLEVHDGRDHRTIYYADLRQRVDREVVARFRQGN